MIAEDTMLIALTRIERAADSYCCRDDSDAEQIIKDILAFAKEGIASFPYQHLGKHDE